MKKLFKFGMGVLAITGIAALCAKLVRDGSEEEFEEGEQNVYPLPNDPLENEFPDEEEREDEEFPVFPERQSNEPQMEPEDGAEEKKEQ